MRLIKLFSLAFLLICFSFLGCMEEEEEGLGLYPPNPFDAGFTLRIACEEGTTRCLSDCIPKEFICCFSSSGEFVDICDFKKPICCADGFCSPDNDSCSEEDIND